MKIMTAFSLASALIFLSACKKQEEESCTNQPTPLTVISNGPVNEGWPLTFSLSGYEVGYSYTYRLSGPNGLSIEKPFNSGGTEAGIITLDSVSVSNSGNYLVELLYNGCLIKSNTLAVQVNPVPEPPCSIANNSTTTSQTGIGGTTYNNINGSVSGSSTYDLIATGNSQNITIKFNQGDVPIPGLYTSSIQSLSSNRVSIYIGTFQQYYQMESGHPVYVNLVNGNTIVSFCEAVFHDPDGNGSITISGKITIP